VAEGRKRCGRFDVFRQTANYSLLQILYNSVMLRFVLQSLELLDLEETKKALINREIRSFRDAHKVNISLVGNDLLLACIRIFLGYSVSLLSHDFYASHFYAFCWPACRQ